MFRTFVKIVGLGSALFGAMFVGYKAGADATRRECMDKIKDAIIERYEEKDKAINENKKTEL